MKGQKSCVCGKVVGCRTHQCECGHIFSSAIRTNKAEAVQPKLTKLAKRNKDGTVRKRRKPKLPPIHWTELNKGDQIKIVNGTGPRYITADGRKIPIGYKGQYKVLYLDDNGIHAIGIGKKSVSGHAYIWMNGKHLVGNVLRRPHKIKRLAIARPLQEV